MNDEERVKAIEGFLLASQSQAELILTLSISIIGATAALLVQIALFNRKAEGTPFAVSWLPAVGTSAVFLSASVLVSYLMLGNLTSLRLPLFAATIDPNVSIAQQDIPGLNTYRLFSLLQFAVFVPGFAFAAAFWVRFCFLVFRRQD